MSALEPLLLREAEALAAKVGDADRIAIARALALGRQKVRAGDALWSNGHLAEGLRLAREALLETMEALPLVARAAEEPDDVRALLAKRGLAEPAIARVLDARRRADEPLPRRDPDVARVHAALYDALQLARRDVDRALDPAGRTVRSIRIARVARILGAAIAVLALVAGIAVGLRPRQGVVATASAQFSTGHEFAPASAIDGQGESEWLLPDRASGYLELAIHPPRRVERIVITNARNHPHLDRAAREIRIEVSGGGRALRTIDATFEAFESEPAPRPFEVGVDGVDRVRITVLSWHRTGGGLAEVALE